MSWVLHNHMDDVVLLTQNSPGIYLWQTRIPQKPLLGLWNLFAPSLETSTHNVSRSPNNQTADQGIPQGLLGRWAGGYIGLLGSHEYIVNINRRCYGCKRMFWPELYIFAKSYPQCEKMSTICLYKIHSSGNLKASKETILLWLLSISLKWCTLWPESMSPTYISS